MAMVRTAALLKSLVFRVVSNRRSTAAGVVAIIVAAATDLGYILDPDLVLEIVLYGYGFVQLFMRDATAKKRPPRYADGRA